MIIYNHCLELCDFFFQVTLVSAVVFPWPPHAVNLFFAFCLVLICGSHLLLVSQTGVFFYKCGDTNTKYM